MSGDNDDARVVGPISRQGAEFVNAGFRKVQARRTDPGFPDCCGAVGTMGLSRLLGLTELAELTSLTGLTELSERWMAEKVKLSAAFLEGCSGRPGCSGCSGRFGCFGCFGRSGGGADRCYRR